MIDAPVNKMIPFSTVDGLGNRTVIFLQGCNIACVYCHNPETQRQCCHCGVCIENCPAKALGFEEGKVVWDQSLCVQCDACIKACPHFASPRIRWMNAGQVMVEVEKNMPYIRGITVSGGECTLYPDFLIELFELAKQRGLHCLIDSNGETDLSRWPELIALCDGVMLDVKAWEPECYLSITGSQNEIVKKNLRYLQEAGKLAEIRIVCVDGMTDTRQTITGIAKQLGKEGRAIKLKLIAFRNKGVRGSLSDRESPSLETMKKWEALARESGFVNIACL